MRVIHDPVSIEPETWDVYRQALEETGPILRRLKRSGLEPAQTLEALTHLTAALQRMTARFLNDHNTTRFLDEHNLLSLEACDAKVLADIAEISRQVRRVTRARQRLGRPS